MEDRSHFFCRCIPKGESRVVEALTPRQEDFTLVVASRRAESLQPVVEHSDTTGEGFRKGQAPGRGASAVLTSVAMILIEQARGR